MNRRAVEADITSIVAIEDACFGASAWGDGLVTDEVRSDRHVVLVDDGLAAYGAASVAGDVADLDRIAVLPGSRGHGLARDLVSDLVDHVRDLGADRMLLEVAADNAAAIALYESAGFEVISTRRAYYPDGVDALVMELAINEWR